MPVTIKDGIPLLSGTVSLQDLVDAFRLSGKESLAKRLEAVQDGMKANRERRDARN